MRRFLKKNIKKAYHRINRVADKGIDILLWVFVVLMLYVVILQRAARGSD